MWWRKRVFDFLSCFLPKNSGKNYAESFKSNPKERFRCNSCFSCFAHRHCSQFRHSEHKILLKKWHLMEVLDSRNEPYGTKRLLDAERKFEKMEQLSGKNVVKLSESDF